MCLLAWTVYECRLVSFTFLRNARKSWTMIIFCKIRKIAKESKDMLQQVYGDSVNTSILMFYHWYNVFQDGRESVTDELWEGWPSTTCNEVLQTTVATIVWEGQIITFHEFAQCLNILVSSEFAIFQDDL